MPSGCRPRTPRSRTAATRSPGRCPTSRTCGGSSGRWARPSPGAHEVVTADPSYYRWNQWLFLRFLEAGLAYRAMSAVDWCPNDGTLAREQVEGADRHCWRCGALVEKRDLDAVVPADHQLCRRAARLHRHRLARAGPASSRRTGSAGPRAPRSTSRWRPTPTSRAATRLRVFTTRPDTLFGATFMVLAPEHPLVATLTHPDRRDEVAAYVERARRETEIERLSTEREKTGVAHRRRGDQPGQRRADPDLHRRLRAGRLRHRRDHGRARPRRARLRLRQEVRTGHPARRGGPRHRRRRRPWRTPTSPTRRTSTWSTAAGSTACPPTRAGRRSSPGWRRPGAPSPRSPTGCATG